MCVLDFYIHENYQRRGIGRRLFRVHLVGSCVICVRGCCVSRPSWRGRTNRPTPLPTTDHHRSFLDFLRNTTVVFSWFSQDLLINLPHPFHALHQDCPEVFIRTITSLSLRHFSIRHSSFESKYLTRCVRHISHIMSLMYRCMCDRNPGAAAEYPPTRLSLDHPRNPVEQKNRLQQGKHAIKSQAAQLCMTPMMLLCRSQKSTTSASSSIISRYSGFQKLSRASEASVDSVGNPKEPFGRATRRPPLRPLPKRLPQCSNRPPIPSRIPMGPYPGWQPLEPGPRIQSRRKKESVGLTRLTPIQNFAQQQPPTPSCRCVPPWATGLAADRTVMYSRTLEKRL